MKLQHINEVKEFNSKEFDKSVDKAITELWKAYNKLEVASNLLRKAGQTNKAKMWDKKIRVIEDAINKVDGK